MLYLRDNGPLFLFCFVLILVVFLFSARPVGKTVIEADRLEVTSKKTLASGDAKLTRNEFSLSSDLIEIRRRENADHLSARGDIVLTSTDLEISAETLSAILGEGESSEILEITLIQGSGETESFRFSGEEVKLKLDEGNLDELNLRKGAELEFGEDSALSGREISIVASKSDWKLEASGDLEYKAGDTELLTSGMKGKIVSSGETGETRLTDLEAENPSGEIGLNGRSVEAGKLRFSGETASFGSEGDSRLSGVDFSNGSFTTCEGCECGSGCAYSISSDRTSVANGKFVLARSAQISSFGLPVWRAPLYFVPLKDYGLPERSYFPRIGFSSKGGFSFNGAAPLFVNENNFGNIRADFSTRTKWVGAGLDFYSGGEYLNGIGEFYGLYRSTGPNYFSADTFFEIPISEWLGLNADLDYRKGPYRGTDYDGNEWSFNLEATEPGPGWELAAVREETKEKNGTRVVERLPELSINWGEPLGLLPFKNELRADLGYYRERLRGDSNGLSAGRAGFDWSFSTEISPIEGFSIPLSGKGRIDQYFNPVSGDFETRGRESLAPGLRLEGPGTLELTFDHTAKTGKSPFEFDSVNSRNKLNFDYSGSQYGIEQNLSLQYFFPPGDGFSDLKYEAGFGRGGLDQDLALEYSLPERELKSIGTTTFYSLNDFVLELSTGYDFTTETIAKSGLGFGFHRGENDLEFQLTGKPFQTWLKDFSADIDLEIFDGWSLGLSGKYDLVDGNLSELSYSAYNTIQNCLKVGISGDDTGLWFDVQVVGF
ncbi:MAG: hypothetical protein ACOC49_03415 [Candidatus Bipolaricaulota bacterium]